LTGSRNYDEAIEIIHSFARDASARDVRVLFRLNKKNRGFTHAVNQGLRHATGDFILFLNPDVQLMENSVERMAEFLAVQSDVGIVAPQLLYPNGRIQPSCRHFPRYRDAPGLILVAFGLSVLNQLLVVIVYILLAPGLGVDLPVFQFVVVLILVSLVASLPISLGGLGAREGAMMSLLLPLGVEPASVLALSMAYLLVLWSCSLPGAFMLLLKEPDVTDAVTRRHHAN